MRTDLWFYFLLLGMIWAWLVVFTIRRIHSDPEGSVGLPTAVVLIMSFLYGGAFVYAVPGYSHLRPGANWYLDRLDFSEMMVLKGTIASLIGLFAFSIGTGAFRQKIRVRRFRPADISTAPLPSRRYRKRATFALGTIGVMTFLGHYVGLNFPMSAALFETGRNVTVAFLVLGAYLAMREGRSYVGWFLVAALVPIYYLGIWGFTSLGFMFVMAIAGFWMSQLRKPTVGLPRIASFAFTIGAIWILLTLFVGWFSLRDEIRMVVWSNQEGSVLRIILAGAREMEMFSPWNFDSLDFVNIRLDLPLFIGKMMERHLQIPDLRAWGSTLYILPLVLLPRFVWPDKPVRGGTEFMSQHTGLTFTEDVTFGTGSVFEFYVNFGYLGVFFGFLILGWFVRYLDLKASRSLISGKYISFMIFMTLGLYSIDPLLRPFFIFNGLVFSFIVLNLAKPVLQAWLVRRG